MPIDLLNVIFDKGIVEASYFNDKSHSLFPFIFNRGMDKNHKEWTMTKEQTSISNHNKYLAWKHFYPEGNGKAKKGHCLHHVNPDWKHTDIERYIQWNVEDLVMMTNYAHKSLHNKSKQVSEETKRKISEARMGIQYSNETISKMSESHKGEKNYWFGHHLSEEHKRKISEAKKGKAGRPVSEETRRKMSESHKKRFAR